VNIAAPGISNSPPANDSRIVGESQVSFDLGLSGGSFVSVLLYAPLFDDHLPSERDSVAIHHQNKSFSGAESGTEFLKTGWQKRA
jgi:hypothetical protein